MIENDERQITRAITIRHKHACDGRLVVSIDDHKLSMFQRLGQFIAINPNANLPVVTDSGDLTVIIGPNYQMTRNALSTIVWRVWKDEIDLVTARYEIWSVLQQAFS